MAKTVNCGAPAPAESSCKQPLLSLLSSAACAARQTWQACCLGLVERFGWPFQPEQTDCLIPACPKFVHILCELLLQAQECLSHSRGPAALSRLAFPEAASLAWAGCPMGRGVVHTLCCHCAECWQVHVQLHQMLSLFMVPHSSGSVFYRVLPQINAAHAINLCGWW